MMTIEPLHAYLTIALLAAVTLGTRLGGAAIMRLVAMSPRVTRFLEAMSVSVLAAIVVTFLAQGGRREALAVIVAIGTMLIVRRPVWAMVAAMAAASAWTHFIDYSGSWYRSRSSSVSPI